MSINPAVELSEFTFGVSDCSHDGKNKFWVPVIQGERIKGKRGQYQWLDDRFNSNKSVINLENWAPFEPNGENLERCVEMKGAYKGHYLTKDKSCNELRCSICIMPLSQRYFLRGQHKFDHEYNLLIHWQSSENAVVFEGTLSSRVTWYPLERRTEITNGNNKTLSFDQDPFGRLWSDDKVGYTRLIFTNVRNKHKYILFHCHISLMFVCFLV